MELLFDLSGAFLVFTMLLGLTITMSKGAAGFFSGGANITTTDVTGIECNPTVLAAQPAVLTTRTNGTSGSLTMTNSVHGIVTGQRVDLYWTGGQCYGAVVGTVAGAVVPIASVSGGTALPIATTVINVGICISSPFPVTGNNIQGLVATGSALGYFVFNNGSADVGAVLNQANDLYQWYVGSAFANPLAGATPTVVWMSHNDPAAAHKEMACACVTH